MKIFVASWFFPPATSSEGIVTYKLLRNSKHQYDVFSSSSKQWGYQREMNQLGENNIRHFAIQTDNIENWVDACIEQFEQLYAVEKYQCIMTRSMPPESILVGKYVKEKYPHVKWVASLADPIANNPYELKSYIDDCITLTKKQKADLKSALKNNDLEKLILWKNRPEAGIQHLCNMQFWQDDVTKLADLIISPTATQLSYINEKQGWLSKYFTLPHSFDSSLYPEISDSVHEKVIFSYIGYSDKQRSLEPIIRAVRLLKQKESPFLDRLEIRVIGNNPRYIKDMVLKLADYMGARKPIFALTGKGSPADNIISKYGGVRLDSSDTAAISNTFEQILLDNLKVNIQEKYRSTFESSIVAKQFDKRIDELCGYIWNLRIPEFPNVLKTCDSKLVTICIPAYNVERYLERCIRSLIDHDLAGKTEILVIDDGSKDHTSDIAKIFEASYPGIVRLIQKENGGHGSTINRGISEGIGKYFMVVDGDDWIDSSQFSELLKKIDTGEIDTDIISSNYHEINMESGLCTPWVQSGEIEYFETISFDNLDTQHVYFTLASSLFRLSLLQKMNKSLQEHTFYVDVEYILFPIPYVKTVMFVDYYIYKYCRGNVEQSVHIPTMIKRYDHHDRVMRSVLDYGINSIMSPKQTDYYESILKKLLFTQYSLCFLYDDDKSRGYQRAKDFDSYLSKTNPSLAKWAGKSIPHLRIARKYNFNYIRAKHSLRSNIQRGKNYLKNRILK